MEASAVRIQHPNREKPESKATKAGVVLLLLASAALIAIVLVGGWERLAGAHIVAVAYILIYLLMAYFVARWSRGALPMAAGAAIVFTTFAAVAAPGWFARDKDGFSDPLLPAALVGLLVLVLIAVQVLLVIFAMRAFQQEWNIEVEVRDDGDHGEYGEYGYSEDDAYDAGESDERETGEHDTIDAPPDSARDSSDRS